MFYYFSSSKTINNSQEETVYAHFGKEKYSKENCVTNRLSHFMKINDQANVFGRLYHSAYMDHKSRTKSKTYDTIMVLSAVSILFNYVYLQSESSIDSQSTMLQKLSKCEVKA